MYKLCFLTLFICLAAYDTTSLTFNPLEAILAECVEQQLVKYDDTFEFTQVAKRTANLAARRFHGKSMSKNVFSNRLSAFYQELRSGKLKSNITEDQFSEKFRVTLRQALFVCANITSVKDEKLTEITIKNEAMISFGPHMYFLSGCIESHLKLTGRREFTLRNGFTKFIADSAARRFHGKSMSKNDFHERHIDFFKYLRRTIRIHNFTRDQLSSEVQSIVRQALEGCAMDKYPLVAVPTFENEPSRIAHILNLILVKWPKDLYHMIQSKNDRAVLRRFTNDALNALMSELNVFQNNTRMFRLTLRYLWNKRAREMYDGNSVERPYILHRYRLNYLRPHMVHSDIGKFISRNSSDFNVRNPVVLESQIHEILNVHRPDHPNSNGETDIYDNYRNNVMTSAEYFFENQINQFYRILFFLLELQARGIFTENNDVFEGSLPNSLIPEPVQAIVYDNDVYRDYLLYKKSSFKNQLDNCHSQDDIAENIINNVPVLEENLILLMSNVPSTSGIQSRSESVTTIKTMRTSTQSLKRKDDVWKNEKGKCFSKRAKTTLISKGSANENIMMEDYEEVTKSTVQESSNFFVSDFTDEDSSMCFFDEFSASLKLEKNETDPSFGYVTSNYDTKPFQFSDEEFSVIQDMSCFSDN